MDELLAADELAAAQRDAEYRRLVAEQAALRRLAVLVTRGVEPSEVFDAVVKEMRRCLDTERAGLWRYETSGEITLLASDFRSAVPAKWPGGTRTPIDGNTLAAMVKRTGGPARMDSYEESTGQLATRIHAMGLRAAVGVPVVVDGGVWGLAAVGWAEPGPMPADIEARISAFAELIGTALVCRVPRRAETANRRRRVAALFVDRRATRGPSSGRLQLGRGRRLPQAAKGRSLCGHCGRGSLRSRRASDGHRIEVAQPRRVFGMAAPA